MREYCTRLRRRRERSGLCDTRPRSCVCDQDPHPCGTQRRYTRGVQGRRVPCGCRTAITGGLRFFIFPFLNVDCFLVAFNNIWSSVVTALAIVFCHFSPPSPLRAPRTHPARPITALAWAQCIARGGSGGSCSCAAWGFKPWCDRHHRPHKALLAAVSCPSPSPSPSASVSRRRRHRSLSASTHGHCNLRLRLRQRLRLCQRQRLRQPQLRQQEHGSPSQLRARESNVPRRPRSTAMRTWRTRQRCKRGRARVARGGSG